MKHRTLIMFLMMVLNLKVFMIPLHSQVQTYQKKPTNVTVLPVEQPTSYGYCKESKDLYPIDAYLNKELEVARSLKGIDTPKDKCKGVYVDSFGAEGDGLTDDRAAIMLAANDAQNKKDWLIFSSGKSYKVSDYIVLRNGIKGALVCGENPAKIIAPNGKAFLIPDRVENILIQGFIIDAMNSNGNLVYGRSVKNVTIRGNSIINHGSGSAISFIAIRDVGSQEYIVIEDNIISSKLPSLGAPYSESIKIGSMASFSAPIYWKKNHSDMPTTERSVKVKITNNDITGGYYGIGTNELSYSLIAENKIQNNIRNISMQQGCSYNIVKNNTLLNSKSASIHMAYNPNHNYIYSNIIRSDRAAAWGAIQIQLGGKKNRIENNVIENLSNSPKDGWYYFIYVVIHAEGNQIIGNDLSGSVKKAYIGLETNWGRSNETVNVTNPVEGKWSVQSSENNVIYSNKILVTSNKPAIYLGQIKDQHGDHLLINTHVVCNSVNGDANAQFIKQIETSENGIKGLKVVK